jgi:hypothetical protein
MATKYYNTCDRVLRPNQFRHKLGTIVYHKDRVGRLRPKIQTDKGMVDAPSYLYEHVYKLGKVEKGDSIMVLDGDRTNLSKENLIKVTNNERNYIISRQTNAYDVAIKNKDIFELTKDLATLHESLKEVNKNE